MPHDVVLETWLRGRMVHDRGRFLRTISTMTRDGAPPAGAAWA
jgi:hypothetical protein